MIKAFNRGDFVEVDGALGVVVGVAGEQQVPEEHLAIWFGVDKPSSAAQEEHGVGCPEVWTIPQEYVQAGPNAIVHH
jgi:hypothetical protein